jgi:hypothetical protein
MVEGGESMVAEFPAVIQHYHFKLAAGEGLSLIEEDFEEVKSVGLTPHGVDKLILGEAIDNL